MSKKRNYECEEGKRLGHCPEGLNKCNTAYSYPIDGEYPSIIGEYVCGCIINGDTKQRTFYNCDSGNCKYCIRAKRKREY